METVLLQSLLGQVSEGHNARGPSAGWSSWLAKDEIATREGWHAPGRRSATPSVPLRGNFARLLFAAKNLMPTSTV
jgi:hypothetical protein